MSNENLRTTGTTILGSFSGTGETFKDMWVRGTAGFTAGIDPVILEENTALGIDTNRLNGMTFSPFMLDEAGQFPTSKLQYIDPRGFYPKFPSDLSKLPFYTQHVPGTTVVTITKENFNFYKNEIVDEIIKKLNKCQ